jgi:hypothetical protein
VIKEKSANLGLKDITDKDSWIDAKKIINAHLRRPPYCPGPDSKKLVTTPDNQVASCWWEEVLNYYLKPPISDWFVEESQYDGKGFKMIDHINKYFNPSGAVNSLGYIFDLIDIKQASDKSVITLKAWLSCLFGISQTGGRCNQPSAAGRVHAPGPSVPLPQGGSGLLPWLPLSALIHTSIRHQTMHGIWQRPLERAGWQRRQTSTDLLQST